MDYLIQAYENSRPICGTDAAALVYDAKTFRKVQNRLNYFSAPKYATEIKIFSYVNLYNEATYKLIKTVKL